MPRRSSKNDKQKEPPRTVRRSSRLKTNNDKDSDSSTAKTQATPAGAASQQQLKNDSTFAQRSSSKQAAKDSRPSKSKLRIRKRNSSSSDDNEDASGSRKKSRSSPAARVSVDAAVANNDDQESRKASPNVNVKNAPTITPGYSVQSNTRGNEHDDDEEGNGSKSDHSNASLMGSTNDDSDSSRTSSTSSSSVSSSQIILPQGVVNLYSFATATRARTCRQGFSISKSLNTAFLARYGFEFYEFLKEHEVNNAVEDSDILSSSPTSGTPRSSLYLGASRNRPVLGSAPLVGDTETLPNQPYLTEKMRAILMDWLVELSEEYKFKPETLQLAVALVDACLACGPPAGSEMSIEQAEANGYFVVRREMLQCVGWYVLLLL